MNFEVAFLGISRRHRVILVFSRVWYKAKTWPWMSLTYFHYVPPYCRAQHPGKRST